MGSTICILSKITNYKFDIMKKLLAILSITVTLVSTSSCGAFANMSYEDAYNVGYGIGTLGRYLIDN